MFTTTAIRVGFTALVMLCATSQAQQPAPQTTSLESAFYNRQYEQVAEALAAQKNKDLNSEIMAVSVAVAQDSDDKEAMLNALIKRHPENAEVHFVAGELWYQIKEQSNLFNKLGLVEKSNKHSIRAAELAPNNPKYLVAAAKALAIESGFWDSEKKASKAIVERLKDMDKHYYYLALMDYLQNTQNESLALQTVDFVNQHYPHDIALVNRAANLLWTFSAKEQAQNLFAKGCQINNVATGLLPTWRDTCVSAAYLALQEHGDKQLAVDAMEHLISKEQVEDEQHIEYLMLLGELSRAVKDNNKAKSAYQQALTLSNDSSTKRDIRRALDKVSQ
ncbi:MULTISPECIES: tetratricopeptide repeat protein [unclassified Pseudoalteromonas]|uniref:tetratricopeptide repeat protein n=1 Tax=unclassified Pseudoalteromonas TaxID=194690 RepID=UPI001F3D82D9|nr:MULTISPECIES: hypothetical protein [unclassified Pseudoalteromonas]MCF2829126.1 hypothetical protein [Pseudoalteromonas sp. OF5H-5]MCF2831563.1 hypothetical protein [Pseudoalteromonas sp. DL2-H6]MCF2927679.1 hypothetical protein [Pseudoalteromonas sp. DL2-H1]